MRCCRGDRGQAAKARNTFVRSADGGESVGLAEAPVWLEGLCLDRASLDDGQEGALGHLTLAELQAGVGLRELERVFRRRKQNLLRPFPEPERPSDSAGQKEDVWNPLVDPGGRHRPVQLLEGKRAVSLGFHQGEDDLRVDGHVRFGTVEAPLREELLVVLDDAVVDPDDGAVADGMIVGREGRVALRVVAYVDEHLTGLVRNAHRPEQLTGAGALLGDLEVEAGAAVRVSDRVRATLGDCRQESLRRESAIDAALAIQAISGDPAHGWCFDTPL